MMLINIYMMFNSYRRNCYIFIPNNEIYTTQLNSNTIGAVCELVPEDMF